MSRLSAHDLIALVLDDDSWISWDTAPERVGTSEAYAAELAAAAERSGVDESVLTGEARLHGRRIGVLVGEFGFLAGSIGRAAADRIVAGIERATREGLPLVAAPISGGTRMQEGTPAFVQMVRISAAIAAVVVFPFVADTSATPRGRRAARRSSAPGSTAESSLPGRVVPPPRRATRGRKSGSPACRRCRSPRKSSPITRPRVSASRHIRWPSCGPAWLSVASCVHATCARGDTAAWSMSQEWC